MRRLVAAVSMLMSLGTGAAYADFLPLGTYDCTLQPEGTMKLQEIGVLDVIEGGFGGPAPEDEEAAMYVYLLNPDNSVNWPVAFATSVEGGKEVVDATFYPFLDVVQTNILMEDGSKASVACGRRPD